MKLLKLQLLELSNLVNQNKIENEDGLLGRKRKNKTNMPTTQFNT